MGKTTEKKNNIYRLSKNTHNRNSFNILLAEDDKEMRSLLALMLRKKVTRSVNVRMDYPFSTCFRPSFCLAKNMKISI